MSYLKANDMADVKTILGGWRDGREHWALFQGTQVAFFSTHMTTHNTYNLVSGNPAPFAGLLGYTCVWYTDTSEIKIK